MPRGPRASLLSVWAMRPSLYGPAPLVGRASVRYPAVRVMSHLGPAPVSVTVRRRSRGGPRSGTPRYPVRFGSVRFGSVSLLRLAPVRYSLVLSLPRGVLALSGASSCTVLIASRTLVLLTPSHRHARLRGVFLGGLLLCSCPHLSVSARRRRGAPPRCHDCLL